MQTVPSVTMDPSVYLPSTWRNPIGALLTSRRITQYMREGRYGKEAQAAASQSKSLKPCAKCGSEHASFLRFSYLPHAMWCCHLCREAFRSDHEKAEALEHALREKVRAANKALKAEREQCLAARRAEEAIVFA